MRLIILLSSIHSVLQIHQSLLHLDLYLKFFTVYLLDKAKVLDIKELKAYNQEVTEYIEKKYKENNWKISFCYQKDEPFFVNLSINIVVLCKKLKLTNILLWFLNKVYYKGKKK